MTYRFDAQVWQWEGKAAWHFVSLPEDITDAIDAAHGGQARGFGSLRVRVQVGDTAWATSIFPDTKRGTFLLPLKKAVRVAEGLDVGTTAHVELDVVV